MIGLNPDALDASTTPSDPLSIWSGSLNTIAHTPVEKNSFQRLLQREVTPTDAMSDEVFNGLPERYYE